MMTPYSAGMLNNSPLDSNTARFASGEMSNDVMLLDTFTVLGIRVATSVITLIFTSAYLLVERLRRCNLPPASNTKSSGPDDIELISTSSKSVIWSFDFFTLSYTQILRRRLEPASDT